MGKNKKRWLNQEGFPPVELPAGTLAPDLAERAVRVACLKAALEMRTVAKPNQTIIIDAMEFEEYVLGDHRLQQDPETPEGEPEQAPEED